MRTYRAVVHRAGPALWPDHKPLAEVLKLRTTTPALIWEGTYQGNPSPAGGYTFRREWWSGKNRYKVDDRGWATQVIGRFQSWDFAVKDKQSNDPSACLTADLLADYRLLLREVYVDRLTFDVVPATVISMARRWNGDGLLRNVLIEDASSGTPAYQTLMATAEAWLRPLLFAMRPVGSKVERAGAASVWCANDMVWLPHPGLAVPWLLDYEDELFSFPQGAHDDQVDVTSQVIYSARICCRQAITRAQPTEGGNHVGESERQSWQLAQRPVELGRAESGALWRAAGGLGDGEPGAATE